MLTLYHGVTSTCSKRVRITLAEKGVEWDSVHLKLAERENLDPDYLKLNPNGVVPTLVHDGRVLTESNFIIEYLDEVFPDPPLHPLDPVEKAHMRTWTRRPDDGLHRACATLTNTIAFRLQWLEQSPEDIDKVLRDTPDPVRREWRREMIELGTDSPMFRRSVWHYDALLDDMDSALANRPWLAGEDYTLADVSLTSYINRIAELQLHPLWESARPRVTDWFDRVRARRNFETAFGGYPYESYAELMKEQGSQQWPKVEAALRDL
jgi:glutathione S-transferase